MPEEEKEELTKAQNFREIGSLGLKQQSGIIAEDFVPKLKYLHKRIRAYKEMRSDPVVGAILFAIEMHLRRANWHVEGEDEDLVDFVEDCKTDMSHSFQDFLSEALSMLPYGFSVHEIVYKGREDGKVGWKKLPIRSQDSIERWEFDSEGGLDGVYQRKQQMGSLVYIPVEKFLLFRPSSYKNNPEGKALDPNTEIPTPNGWKFLGSLSKGDKVFDEDGKIRYITATKWWEERPRYKLHFNNGETIIADENHQWRTQLVHERSLGSPAKLRTTKEIYNTQKDSNGVTNHTIAWTAPLDYSEQLLAVNPYLLGLWLGDGSSDGGRISTHVQDVPEEVESIENIGYDVNVTKSNGKGRCITVYGLSKDLRSINVLNNKHIPKVYLRGSFKQRFSLLQGLMDSDGYIDKLGRIEFVNTNKDLIKGTAELLRSLGIGCRVRVRRKGGTDYATKKAWAVAASPEVPIFRLQRKKDRMKGDPHNRPYHYITKVEKIEPGTTKCIEIDGESHMFLASRSMIPTHNSILRSAYKPYYFKKKIETIEAIGIERDLSGYPTLTVPGDIFGKSEMAQQRRQYAEKMITRVRKDEQMGAILPPGWDLDLLNAGGRSKTNAGEVIQRYSLQIAQSLLSDIIYLGHTAGGSFALSEQKYDLFVIALESWLASIREVFNQFAIPRLMRLNGIDNEERFPEFVHDPISSIDPQKLSNIIFRLAGVDAIRPDDDLEKYLRNLIGAPMADPETARDPEADNGEGQQNDPNRSNQRDDQDKRPAQTDGNYNQNSSGHRNIKV